MKYTEEEKKAIENLNEILTHKNDVDIAYGYNIERPYPIGREKIAQLEIIKNLIEKQQKEIEIKDKRINALQRIIGKDLPTNQAYISTFCGIPIEEAMDMIEICKTQTIHLNDQEYKKVVELAQKDCIPKETIRNKIKELENQKISIKVGFEKIFETKMDNAKIIDTLRELLRGE